MKARAIVTSRYESLGGGSAVEVTLAVETAWGDEPPISIDGELRLRLPPDESNRLPVGEILELELASVPRAGKR